VGIPAADGHADDLDRRPFEEHGGLHEFAAKRVVGIHGPVGWRVGSLGDGALEDAHGGSEKLAGLMDERAVDFGRVVLGATVEAHEPIAIGATVGRRQGAEEFLGFGGGTGEGEFGGAVEIRERLVALEGDHLGAGNGGGDEGVVGAAEIQGSIEVPIEHALLEGGLSWDTVLPVLLAVKVGAGLSGVPDAMEHGEVAWAFLTIEGGLVVDLHHGLEGRMELGEAIAEIEGLSLGDEQGGPGVGAVGRVSARDDGVDAVVAAVLEDEDQLLIGGQFGGEQSSLKETRREKIDAEGAPGEGVGFEEFAAGKVHGACGVGVGGRGGVWVAGFR
jgi:hypothetical protein